MAFSLRCPECRRKFPWNPSAKWPDACPFEDCAVEMTNENAENNVVTLPAFLSPKTKATDGVYESMVKGSEFRAQAAADLAGVPVSEMSNLKITDLNTRRDAEIMAKEPVNEVSTFMRQTGVGGFQGSNGAAYGGAVQTGPFPNVGAATRTMIQKQHPVAATSDRPALETAQPGYRRRG